MYKDTHKGSDANHDAGDKNPYDKNEDHVGDATDIILLLLPLLYLLLMTKMMTSIDKLCYQRW